jgi:predicted RND superfamily exporter protein
MQRLTRASLDHPRLAAALLVSSTLLLAAGAPRVETVYGARVLIGKDHPVIRTLEGFIGRFGGGLPIHISWACDEGAPCESVFDPVSLRMAATIESELAVSQGIQRVEGLATSPLLVPARDGFSVRRLVEDGEIPADVDELANLAIEDRFWLGRLVSKDAKVGVVIVQQVDTDPETDELAVNAIARAIAPFEAQGFRFYQTGGPAGSVLSGRALADSTRRLVPVTVTLIGLVLFLLSRSLLYTVVTLVTMGAAILWTTGTMGWFGWPQDGIHEVLVPLILVIGVCDAIHFLSRYSTALGDQDGRRPELRRASLIEAASEVAPACLVTTLTTGGALLSFSTSTLDTFFRFGIISAIGVTICLVLTFTLLPLLVQLLPHSARPESAGPRWQNALAWILRFSEREALPILAATGLIFVVSVYGWIAYLRVDTSWQDTLGRNSYVTKSVEFFEERLAPSRHLEVELRLPAGTQVEDPRSIDVISSVAERIPTVQGLGSTSSVVELLSQLNRLIRGNDPAFDRPADSTAGNAELLEIISFDDDTILGTWLSLDRSSTRISADAFEHSQIHYGASIRAVEQILDELLPADWDATITGYTAMENGWLTDVQATQTRSFPAAFAIVFALATTFFRSMRLALVALLPTLLPVVVILGVMGWIGLSLDVGRAMIAAVMLGIGVDDSIHILMRYQALLERGATPSAAIRGAIMYTGRAVVTTSLALSLGFLTLLASAWHSISSFGFFIAVGIVGALVASLLVLPALVFASDPERARVRQAPVVAREILD